MTPVLLDTKSLVKAGITVTLIVGVVFISGYTIGYHRAHSGKGVDLHNTMVLALPSPAHADVAEFEPFTPRAQLPGADIDVDRPDISVDVIEKRRPVTPVNQAETQRAAVITRTTNAIETASTDHVRGFESRHGYNQQHPGLYVQSSVAGENNSTGILIEAEQAVGHQQDGGYTGPAADSTASDRQTGIIDTARADDARYSIQVGVFSNKQNANRKKSELESQQLTAYINEYRSKSDQPRFNVRFGYFKDKSSATAALTRFEQGMSGSGYVTRIRHH